MYTKTRPSIRPSIFTPRHAPVHHRPSHSLKNVGIFQNSCESPKFMSHQRLSAPPRAPPWFMVVKFKIRAQTFHIIIFHENAFLLMYRPNRLFEIRSFTMGASFQKILTSAVFAAPFFSTRRTNLIQSALCFPELRQPFKYTERCCTTNEKFFRASQSQWTHSKLGWEGVDSERFTHSGASFPTNPYRRAFCRAIFFLRVART